MLVTRMRVRDDVDLENRAGLESFAIDRERDAVDGDRPGCATNLPSSCGARISSRQEAPKSSIAVTVPTPSTCLLTRWPPMRSPEAQRLFEVHFRALHKANRGGSVSFDTSTSKVSGPFFTTVRHTPLTAIESPMVTLCSPILAH